MSVKEKRSVTFEVPETKAGCSEPNNNNSSRSDRQSGNKEDSRCRPRSRSRSWTRFRSRRAKSQDARPSQDANCSNNVPPAGIKRDRSLASLVRTGSRSSVRSLVKLFEIRSMSEGRKSQIVLLDERRLDIIIQPKLYSSELLDLVASHFKLKEKQYFGLGFFDDTSHFNWLQGEKRVLDHEFPKKTGLLVLHFAIKFYVDTIGLLRDIQTVELFYLNARQSLYRGQLECDTETVFELAAHVLQATNGDFVSEEETREELKKLPVIPTCTLKEHPSIGYCEDRVICFYEKITGTSRGLAIVNYMTIVEKLATYGIHYYDVKDKKDIPWWLGISPKGIAVYDKKDKTTPRKLFTWKNLENLYYRDKKFSIEVHGPKRIIHTLSSFSPYDDAVREPADTFDDLASAITDPTTHVEEQINHHGLERMVYPRSHRALPHLPYRAPIPHLYSQLPSARSMSEIAADLCRSTTSLPGSLGSDLSRSPSSHSLPSLSNSRYDLTIEQSDSLKAERDMYQALKARKLALEESLKKKIEELKMLCLQEGELSGELPPDFPMAPGEQPPVFRRRVGTAFSLSVKNMQDTDQLSNELSKLELEVELQGKITTAAHRLASDKTVSKYVRKQRKQSYTKAFGKLKEMEKKLDDMRKKIRKPASDPQAGRSADDHQAVKGINQTPSDGSTDAAGENNSHRTALSPSHSSPQLSGGFSPNGGVGRGSYRTAACPSAHNGGELDTSSDNTSTVPPATNLRLDGSHDSGFSSANNMYNVTSQRTSHYESTDQLRSPATSEPGVVFQGSYESGSHFGPFRRGAGDEPFQRKAPGSNSSNLHYGSLDRKRRDYRQEIYRDVSPVRYKGRQGRDGSDSEMSRREYGGRGRYRDMGGHGGVIVEVPVHHERGQSMPPPSSTKPVWGDGTGTSSLHQSSDHDRLKQGAVGAPPHSSDHCYSPRLYESSGHRPYQDLDATHVHPTHQEYGRGVIGHHTASQPVFHRTERSISPLRSHHTLPPHYQHQQQQRPLPPSCFERQQGIPHQQQHSYNFQQSVTSPTHSHQSPTGYYSSTARTIPIQRIETPPSSSPTLQYSQPGGHHGGSPASSGPSSPRGPAGHATSTLVTVTRLQPHTEVSKPYEISDFYRYSEKLRRQRIIDQYQRQLIGEDWMSRSSSPLSFESEGHSSQPGSASSNHANQSPTHQPVTYSNSSASLKQPTRGPPQPYNRSVSAPVSTLQSSYYPQQMASSTSHHNQPPTSSTHYGPANSSYPERHVSSSSSTYTVKTHGPNMHYAMQSSTYKIQQVHSSTKHSMYQPPQPMTCKPVKGTPSSQPDGQRR